MATQLPTTGQATGLQLNDIHLPEQISNLPTAMGWWLLVIMMIVTTVWLSKKFRRNKELSRCKNHALKTLKSESILTNSELISLLKWGAMQYFDRQQVANLHGDNFQQFLQEKLPKKYQKDFKKLSTRAFEAQYRDISPEDGNDDCRNAAKLWISYALPPIKYNSKQKEILAHD
jgi:hypothetical protein